jgi:hypothetical protein
MESDIRYGEPSFSAFEQEKAASAEQWANWTTNQIRGAVETERERTFGLLTELLVQIQRDVIPEVVATLPALRGPAGPAGKLPIAKEWTRETVFYEGSVVTYDGGSYQALRDTGEPPDNEAHCRIEFDALRSEMIEVVRGVPVMSDGTRGPPLNLRGLFEQFQDEVG